MGNNQAYAFFEITVVNLYDKGLLTIEVLDTVAETYEGMDADEGGSQDLIAQDGKDLKDIVLGLLVPDFTVPEGEDKYEYRFEEFYGIRRDRWGWR